MSTKHEQASTFSLLRFVSDANSQEVGFDAAALRVHRLRRGVSIEAVATAIGVRANTVARWEQGTVQPQERHLVALRRVLAFLAGDR